MAVFKIEIRRFRNDVLDSLFILFHFYFKIKKKVPFAELFSFRVFAHFHQEVASWSSLGQEENRKSRAGTRSDKKKTGSRELELAPTRREHCTNNRKYGKLNNLTLLDRKFAY